MMQEEASPVWILRKVEAPRLCHCQHLLCQSRGYTKTGKGNLLWYYGLVLIYGDTELCQHWFR